MPLISTEDIIPEEKLFHEERVNVYPTVLSLDQIHFWPENNRTIFTFERLESDTKKKVSQLSIEEITQFVADQDIHKIQVLAKSIKRNGVQSPMIIRDDGKLLDGNRRYFACQWLKMHSDVLPPVLQKIPVQVIRQADLTETQELRILAEANFIPDLKVPWPLDAQARAVEDYFLRIQSERSLSEDAAIAEVVSVFGISRQRVNDLLDALTLTKQFIEEGKEQEEKRRRRGIVEDKFVYYWEFRNKATKGNGALQKGKELEEVKQIFFDLMAKGRDNPIKNVKQIEPLIQSRRDPSAWSLLKESPSKNLPVAISVVNAKKEFRQSEDRIRTFMSWLQEAENLSNRSKKYLSELSILADKKSY